MKHKNGTNYYPDYVEARNVRNVVAIAFPEARVVDYQLGWAVQYYRSGPYFPSIPNPADPYNPNRTVEK